MPFSTYSGSDIHSRKHFYKCSPFTLLGLWYSTLAHPHVQILFLFHSTSNCPPRPAPAPGVDALLTLFGLWLSAQICLLFGISFSPDLDFTLHAWPAFYLISCRLNWLSRQAALLCDCFLFPLWHWLSMTYPSMGMLFSLLKFWHFMLHTSLPYTCGSCHFTLFEFWLPILGYYDCMDILFTPPSPLTPHSSPLWLHAPHVTDVCQDQSHLIALWWAAQKSERANGEGIS